MNFTTTELKHIKRLRKQDRQWRWTRWVVLAMGIFSTALSAGFGYLLRFLIQDSPHEISSESALVFAFYWTKCCMYLLLSIWCFVTVIMKWNGDINRRLMLKLLDAQESEKDVTQSGSQED